ncbi:cysteine-rich venom protein TEL1-like [Suncus etruscus]|uniref:cysteine-rich venom protein TEL1-like n=1 Tax=Suncus etruscus TaxID=109475 RepID=UPI00210FF035|nr:cysteine-rich venom protein TEL1-like [Suncus etruscus]
MGKTLVLDSRNENAKEENRRGKIREGSLEMTKKSAIFSLSTDLVKNQKEIVNKHNEFRRSVFPPATNMLRMQWCNESARNAQNWAEKCTLEHSSKDQRRISIGCGENIYKASYAASWSKVIGFWNSEYENFIFGTGPKTNKSVIEDYAQVIWYSSWRIGCGISYCANASEEYFYVCHYCPGGSNKNKLSMPYVRGKCCGACPNDCDNGLCRSKDTDLIPDKAGDKNGLRTTLHNMERAKVLYAYKDVVLDKGVRVENTFLEKQNVDFIFGT